MNDKEESVPVVNDRWHQAVIWHAHLREASEAEFHDKMQAWKAWEADPLNQEVFDEVSRVLEDGSRLRKYRVPSTGYIETDAQDPPERHPLGPPPPPTPAARRPRLRGRVRSLLLGGAITAAFAGLSVTLPLRELFFRIKAPTGHQQVYETGVGEVRSEHLKDGSEVTLGARSAISLQFSAAYRSVRLDRGEAWFRVAHDVHRPFIVSAGTRTITAVGTAFVVERLADRVLVTVTEGVVEVAPQSPSQVPTPILSTKTSLAHAGALPVARGQQFSYEDSGSAALVKNADFQAATAWSEGQLEFDHLSLKDVVQVVNRYSRRTIAVDESSGKQIVTGVVQESQIDAWVRRLPDIYPVKILESATGICVLSRNNTAEGISVCGKSE
jgi:transmembrane sensor